MIGLVYILSTASKDICMGMLSLVLASLLIYLIVQILHPSDKGQAEKEPPLIALKKRYTRGEITQDEYEQALQRITNQGPPVP